MSAQLKTIEMEKISKLAVKFSELQKNKSVLIPMNLVRDFSVFCKMAEVKADATIYVDQMCFTLV